MNIEYPSISYIDTGLGKSLPDNPYMYNYFICAKKTKAHLGYVKLFKNAYHFYPLFTNTPLGQQQLMDITRFIHHLTIERKSKRNFFNALSNG